MFKFFFVTRLQIIDVLLRLDVFIVAIMNINSPFRIKIKKKKVERGTIVQRSCLILYDPFQGQ